MIGVSQFLASAREPDRAPAIASTPAIPVNHGPPLSPLAPESTFLTDPANAACDWLLDV
jgi:hypothetical protein